MSKKLGCLHAHYSNIDYIEQALAPYSVERTHFVDPGLMERLSTDPNFRPADAQSKVKEQLEWIAKCGVDAILITCTNYIALLPEEQLSLSIPILKIDEPFFARICELAEPQLMLFTNPGTVEGTLKRLYAYAELQQKSLQLENIVIQHTFELMMQGHNERYTAEIVSFLEQLLQKEHRPVSVAQLSMAAAAKQVQKSSAKEIINPLSTLQNYLVQQLKLQPSFNRRLNSAKAQN